MELGLFHFINDTVAQYKRRKDFYVEAEERLLRVFEKLFQEDPNVIAIHSRIKSDDSLRENCFVINSICIFPNRRPRWTICTI